MENFGMRIKLSKIYLMFLLMSNLGADEGKGKFEFGNSSLSMKNDAFNISGQFEYRDLPVKPLFLRVRKESCDYLVLTGRYTMKWKTVPLLDLNIFLDDAIQTMPDGSFARQTIISISQYSSFDFLKKLEKYFKERKYKDVYLQIDHNGNISALEMPTVTKPEQLKDQRIDIPPELKSDFDLEK